MPINIYNDNNLDKIKSLSDDVWSLPIQIDALENWLLNDGKNLTKGNYVADIGFEVRKDAGSGGAILNSKTIKVLNNIGMEIYFSEYST